MKFKEENISIEMTKVDWKVALLSLYTFSQNTNHNKAMADKLDEITELIEESIDDTYKYDER